MKLKHVFLAIAAITISATATADVISDLMKQYKTDWSTAALLSSASKDFSVDPKALFDARSRYGLNSDDVYTGALFSNRTRYNRDQIYKMRASGMGWGVIAKKIGMHPGDFNKMRKSWGSDKDVYDDIWRDRLDGRVSKGDWDWARKQKMSDRDGWLAYVYSREKGLGFRKAADWFRQNKHRREFNEWGAPTKSGRGSKDKDKDEDKGKGKGRGGGY